MSNHGTPPLSPERIVACWRRLAQAGLVERREADMLPSRRWHAALARAAKALVEQRESWVDIRLPMVLALQETLASVDQDEICDLVLVMHWLSYEPQLLADALAVAADA